MECKRNFIEPLELLETPDETRVILNHRGIGDVVTAAYTVAGIKNKTSKRVTYSVLPERKAYAELFLDADEVLTHERPPAFAIDRFDKSVQRFQGRHYLNEQYTRHHQYAKKCKTDPVKPKFATPAPFDWGKVGLKIPPVLVVPESTQPCRMWSRLPNDTDSNWRELIDKLEAEGVPVAVLAGKEFGRSVRAENPAEMMSILNSATVIISVDTGPAHLAGMLGKYVLTLNGIENGPGVFSFYDRVRCIQGKPVAGKQCSPCNRVDDYGFKGICNEWCEALSLVSPDEVFDEVVNILMGATIC